MSEIDEVARALYLVWGEYEMRHGTTLAHARTPAAWNCLNMAQRDQWKQVAIAAAQYLGDTFGAREHTQRGEDWQALSSPLQYG